MKRLLVAVLSLVLGPVSAMEECTQTQYRYTTSGITGAWATSQGAACSAFMGAWVGTGVNGENRSGFGSVVEGTGGIQCRINYSQNYCPGAPEPCTGEGSATSEGYNTQEVPCPEDPCEGLAGTAAYGGSSGNPEGDFCRTDDGSGGPGGDCKVKKSGAGMATGSGWFGQVQFTGESCGGEEEELEEGGPNCSTSPGGRVCVSKDDKNCGSVNGEAVCLDSVPPGSCVLMSGGGAVCDGNPGSTAGPVDEMDEPLEPDAVLELVDDEGDISIINYYSQSTVNGGVGGVTGTDDTGSSGGGGGGDGGLGGCTGDSCDGSLPDDLEELDSFAEITQGFLDRVGQAPIIESVTGVGEAIPSGTCPDWSFEMFDTDLSLSAPMCSIWENISGILSAAMLVVWGLLAARIVLSA